MTDTREVKKELWSQFFNKVSADLRERPVRIEVDSPQLGQQEMGQGLTFQAISFSKKGSDMGSVEIAVDGPFEHRISNPRRVYVEEEAGIIQCLDIEDETGTKTLLFFEHQPALAEHPAPATHL